MLTLENIQQNVFLFYDYAFYDVMKFKFLFSSTSAATRLTGEKYKKRILRMARAFEVKQKAVFRFLKRLPIDPIKLICLEVADITFKDFHLMVVRRW